MGQLFPDKLSGLTKASVKARATRFMAYVRALQTSPDPAVKAHVAPAAALLQAYTQASTAKTKARTGLQEALADLGPVARAVAEALYDVHTAACYVHRRAPLWARRYFDYASLPNRVFSKKKAAAPKAA